MVRRSVWNRIASTLLLLLTVLTATVTAGCIGAEADHNPAAMVVPPSSVRTSATPTVFSTLAAEAPAGEPYTDFMIPPYTRSDAGGDLVAVAQHHTGSLAVIGATANAIDEDGATGWAWIEMDHVLTEAASFIDYEIALDRTVGWAFRGDVSMDASARSSGGLEAGRSAPDGIGPTTVSFRLQNPDGVVEEGTVTLRVTVSAYLRGCGPPFSFLPCSFGVEAGEATVRSITATVHPAS